MTMLHDPPSQHSQINALDPINRVLIVGGTHGNELTGIHTVKYFENHPALLHRNSLKTFTIIGNPQATQHVTRYINKDLNRCFDRQSWPSLSSPTYEVTRAKTLMEHYGPESEQPIDLVIDLHSTTSNAGLMLILDHLNPFTLRLAAYLQAQEPSVKLYSASGSGREHDSMRTLGKYRLGIEVGPIAHGTLHAELFQKTAALIQHTLDYIEHYNLDQNNLTSVSSQKSAPFSPPPEVTVYQYMGAIDYPKNTNGEIIAMIHPQRQFQDYQVVNPGDPMFLTFDGKTLTYQGPTPIYPIFINEAAYYEKGIAMSLTTKISMGITSTE